MRDLIPYLRLIQDDLDVLTSADPDIVSSQTWDDIRSTLADILICLHRVEYLLEVD